MYAPQAAFITELFPTRIRYSGVSIAYQLTAIFAGSLAPIIALWLYKDLHSSVPVSIYVAIACAISGVSALLARETKGVELAEIGSNVIPGLSRDLPHSTRQGGGLPKRFAKRERRRHRHVQRPHLRPDRNPHPRVAGVRHGSRHPGAFLSEQQDVVGLETEIVGRLIGLGREQHQSRRADRRTKRLQPRMTGNFDMIDIIHRRPPHPPVVPSEAQRLDQVDSNPQAGAKPQNGANVPSNLGLEQGNAHTGKLSRNIGGLNVRHRVESGNYAETWTDEWASASMQACGLRTFNRNSFPRNPP